MYFFSTKWRVILYANCVLTIYMFKQRITFQHGTNHSQRVYRSWHHISVTYTSLMKESRTMTYGHQLWSWELRWEKEYHRHYALDGAEPRPLGQCVLSMLRVQREPSLRYVSWKQYPVARARVSITNKVDQCLFILHKLDPHGNHIRC